MSETEWEDKLDEVQKHSEHWYKMYSELKTENAELKAQIEKMKCCGNCKKRGAVCVAEEHNGILCGKNKSKWELAE